MHLAIFTLWGDLCARGVSCVTGRLSPLHHWSYGMACMHLLPTGPRLLRAAALLWGARVGFSTPSGADPLACGCPRSAPGIVDWCALKVLSVAATAARDSISGREELDEMRDSLDTVQVPRQVPNDSSFCKALHSFCHNALPSRLAAVPRRLSSCLLSQVACGVAECQCWGGHRTDNLPRKGGPLVCRFGTPSSSGSRCSSYPSTRTLANTCEHLSFAMCCPLTLANSNVDQLDVLLMCCVMLVRAARA
jgi:hypothetical protein